MKKFRYFTLAIVALALSLGPVVAVGCSSPQAKSVEAAAEYGNEVARCNDAAPRLEDDASVDVRRKAWSDYDSCRAAVNARWAKDGGK